MTDCCPDPFGEDTSGTTSFKLLAKDLITEAYAILQMGSEGEDLTSEMTNEGFRSLNMMVATWQAQGIHLWSYEDAALWLVAGQNGYDLDNSKATNEYTQTVTTTDLLAGGNTVDLQVVGNIFDDWTIGFILSDHSIFWTTVTGVSGNTVTLNDNAPEDILTGAVVFYYEKQLASVERVLGLRRRDIYGNDVPINQISRQEYFDLPSKQSQGLASEGYFDRRRDKGILYLWQVPSNSTSFIMIEYERKLEDFVNNDDCPDFPKYWTEALAYNLAKRLAIKYRVPPVIMNEVKMMAESTLNQALDFDNEVTDMSVSVNREVR